MLTITIDEIKEIVRESPFIESYELEDCQIEDIVNDLYKLYGREAYGSR